MLNETDEEQEDDGEHTKDERAKARNYKPTHTGIRLLAHLCLLDCPPDDCTIDCSIVQAIDCPPPIDFLGESTIS